MKKLLLLLLLCVTISLSAQEIVIFDFETSETSTSYIYFGSSIADDTAHIIDNPNPTGINTSAKVIQYVKPAGSEPWAGAYASPLPSMPIDLTNGGQLCADVHFNHIGNIALKVEQSSTGPNWVNTVANTEINTWQTVCVDVSVDGLEDPFQPALGHIYNQFVIFPDFQIVLEQNDTFFVDNIRYIKGEPMPTALYDFEGEEPGVFTYFASSLDGTNVPVIANPDMNEVNPSEMVLAFTRAAGSETFAGAFSNPTIPTSPLMIQEGNNICVDVWMDHIGNFSLKLEGSATDTDGWIRTIENTEVNTWETLCFSLDSVSIEGAAESAVGHVYSKMAIFPDFLEPAGEVDVITYIDNINYDGQFEEVVVVETSNITFRVDANDLEVAAEGMFLAGDSINNWTAASTPMSDDDGDGVWEVSVDLNPGPVQYKFVNGTTFEELEEGDCTVTDGGFTNRSLTVGENDQVLPIYLFGSCDSPAPGITRVIYDWETEETSTLFRYFGGSIDGDSAAVIANPDPSGVNTSDNVIQYVKPAEAMTWAGAFADPAPTTPIDVTGGGEICVDVWFDHIGNLGVKLEQSSTGGPNWITTVENTEINTWQTLCFDVSAPGLEETMQPAIGHVYSQIVLFPDFGISPAENDTSYIDNIILNTFGGTGVETYNVTFSVDMTNETVGENGMFIFGEKINGWSIDATPMSDADEDGIYEVTVELPEGIIEYKFVNSGAPEEFSEEGECNITDPSGEFINRVLLLEPRDTIVSTYLFNSCALSSDVDDLVYDDNLFKVTPTITSDFVTLTWNNTEKRNIIVVNAAGQVVENIKTPQYEQERILNVSDFASGIYFIKMDTPTNYGIKRIIVE